MMTKTHKNNTFTVDVEKTHRDVLLLRLLIKTGFIHISQWNENVTYHSRMWSSNDIKKLLMKNKHYIKPSLERLYLKSKSIDHTFQGPIGRIGKCILSGIKTQDGVDIRIKNKYIDVIFKSDDLNSRKFMIILRDITDINISKVCDITISTLVLEPEESVIILE